MAKNFKIIVFILILGLSIFLRLWKYPFYPFVGHAEEYLFVWSGLSLIEKGVPISWNDLPVYQEKHIYWQGVAPNPAGGSGLGVRLLKPWLDEPPLFSLIVGGMAKLYNQPNFHLISSYVVRLPSLFFSFLSLILVFILAKRLFSFEIGLLSLLIYGTMPTVVFGSRLAVPENLIVPLFLSSLILILGYLNDGRKWKRDLSFVFSVLAAFAKPTGLLLVPLLASFLFCQKKLKEGFWAGFLSIFFFFILYFSYGFYYDKDLFLKVFLYQAQRPAGWSGLAFLITNPGFSVEVFLDSFLVLGFFALGYLLFKNRDKGEDTLLFSFIFSLLMVVISGGKHDQLAWYRYPIYPFMAIAIALLVREIYRKPTFFASAIFIPLFISNADLLENPFWRLKFFIESRFYRLSFAIFLLPSIFQFFFKGKIWLKLSRIVIVIAFILGIFLNVWVVKSRFNLLCDNTVCPLPQKIDLLKPAIFGE